MMRWLFSALMAFGVAAARAQDLNHPLKIGGDVKKPVLIYSIEPDTSHLPKSEKHSPANATVTFVVDVDGLPKQIELSRSTSPAMGAAYLKAVQQYRFRPATLDGKPVAVKLALELILDYF
ncbi:energy transducer TonB [Granulicella cerasi]|uniref:Energy transducer TonB n=1 Tax=Granulicella cerasi TaxID=741063 RepID=A0ABW1ZAA2_9BACT|nr:energy transducer TonB [Granulicella cerasi]